MTTPTSRGTTQQAPRGAKAVKSLLIVIIILLLIIKILIFIPQLIIFLYSYY
jgi:hypothetical protein